MGYLSLSEETTPATPVSGRASLFLDSADFGRAKLVRSDGFVYPVSAVGPSKNYIINAGLEYAQRQVPATLTTYATSGTRLFAADQWAINAENASGQYQRIDTGGAGTPETGLDARFYGRWKKITSTGKLEVSQVLENALMSCIRGHKVRFQVKLRRTVASSMTARLLAFQLTSAGTADTMPATFITAFGANGTDPTLGTNLSYITVEPNSAENGTISGNGVSCVLGTGWVRYSGVWTVPATCRNFGIMISSDSQLVANDELNVGEPGIYDGPQINDWNPLVSSDEYVNCARYYQKTFEREVAPATNAGVTTGCLRAILGKAAATALAAQFHWAFRVSMRAAPTVTLFNPGAANAQVRQISGTAADLTASTSANITSESTDVTATGAAGGAVGDQVGIHLTADASL